MSKRGPIIILEDDKDDQEIIKEIFHNLHIKNEVLLFESGEPALEYLITTPDQMFLILCDVNMPGMNGLEFRRQVDKNRELKLKSIPFVFLTTAISEKNVKEAYEMSVQGFFQKPANFKAFETLIKAIYDYWQQCRHPNN